MMQVEIQQLIKEALKKALECYQCGDYPSAEEIYRQVLRVDRTNTDALEMGSLVIAQNGKADEAKEWAVRALSRDHDNYKLYNNLGLIHGNLNEHDQAIRCFRIAISKNPSQAFLYTNLAIQLKKMGEMDEAISVLDKALGDHPNNEHIYFNYGALVHENAEYERAIKLYKQAINVNPELAVAHYNLSACYFLLGDYKRAWPEYEWRWKQFANFTKVRERFKEPYWSGEDLNNKTIVLYTEQGVGDTIMMCRFVKDVKKRGAKIVLEVIPPLLDLMGSLEGVDEITHGYDGKFDYHCSLLSLPGILGVTKETIPSASRYLSSVGLNYTDDWEKYVCMRVGICWAGNPQHPNDRNRSVPLKYFRPLAEGEMIELFSFQKDARPHVYPDIGAVDYCEGARGIKFINLAEHMVDFNKTAKMLEKMDAVVTVDTALAHLAGALGVTTYLLLPFLPDWRWGVSGEETPWYPRMTLVRQQKGENWAEVIKRVNLFAERPILNCVYRR